MSKRIGKRESKRLASNPPTEISRYQSTIERDPEDAMSWVRITDLSEKIGLSIRDTLLQVGESYLYVRLTQTEGRVASGWYQLDQECFYYLLFRCNPLDANSEFLADRLTNFGHVLPEGAVGRRIEKHPLLEKTRSRVEELGWMPDCATSEGLWQFDEGLAMLFPYEPIRLKVSDIAIERKIASEIESLTRAANSEKKGSQRGSIDTEAHWKTKRRCVIVAALKAISENDDAPEGLKSFWKKNGTLNLSGVANYIHEFDHNYPSLKTIPENNRTYDFYYEALTKELSAEEA